MIIKVEGEFDKRILENEGEEYKNYIKRDFSRAAGNGMITKIELTESATNIPFKVNIRSELAIFSKEELNSIVNELRCLRSMTYDTNLLEAIEKRLLS